MMGKQVFIMVLSILALSLKQFVMKKLISKMGKGKRGTNFLRKKIIDLKHASSSSRNSRRTHQSPSGTLLGFLRPLQLTGSELGHEPDTGSHVPTQRMALPPGSSPAAGERRLTKPRPPTPGNHAVATSHFPETGLSTTTKHKKTFQGFRMSSENLKLSHQSLQR